VCFPPLLHWAAEVAVLTQVATTLATPVLQDLVGQVDPVAAVLLQVDQVD
jgi:hypothetical protein